MRSKIIHINVRISEAATRKEEAYFSHSYWFGNNVLFRRVRKISNIDYYLHHVCPSACSNSAHTGQIFMKFDIWVFLENLSRKFKFSLKYDKNEGYFPSKPM